MGVISCLARGLGMLFFARRVVFTRPREDEVVGEQRRIVPYVATVRPLRRFSPV